MPGRAPESKFFTPPKPTLLRGFVDQIGDRREEVLARLFGPLLVEFLVEEGGHGETGRDREGTRRLYHLAGKDGVPLAVGRGADADLRIDGFRVSKQHAEIRPPSTRDGAWHVVDLGSTNGTFVDGERLTPHQPHLLQDGAHVGFGANSLYMFLKPLAFGVLLSKVAESFSDSVLLDSL